MFTSCISDDDDDDDDGDESECAVALQCMYCWSTHQCIPYPGGIPSTEVCSLSDLRWATCWGENVLLINVICCRLLF